MTTNILLGLEKLELNLIPSLSHTYTSTRSALYTKYFIDNIQDAVNNTT